MHVLEELRFGSGGVTTEEDIDLASESMWACSFKLFAAATEKLAENTFLNIVALPDTWSQSIDEEVVHKRVLS